MLTREFPRVLMTWCTARVRISNVRSPMQTLGFPLILKPLNAFLWNVISHMVNVEKIESISFKSNEIKRYKKKLIKTCILLINVYFLCRGVGFVNRNANRDEFFEAGDKYHNYAQSRTSHTKRYHIMWEKIHNNLANCDIISTVYIQLRWHIAAWARPAVPSGLCIQRKSVRR